MQALAYRQLVELEREHWWFRGRRAVCMGLIERFAADGPLERILDIGAGAGGFLEPLSQLAPVTHTEHDPAMLAACSERGFPAGVLASADGLPFGDASFDLVCLFDVMEHIERHDLAAAEILRVLRPGGHVFLHVPAHAWLFAENDRIAGHYRRYTRRSIRTLLENTGFAVVHNTHTNTALFPVIAPIVLGMKILERTGLARGHTNLSVQPPRWLQRVCYGLFRSELHLSRRHELPLGHSIATVGKRP